MPQDINACFITEPEEAITISVDIGDVKNLSIVLARCTKKEVPATNYLVDFSLTKVPRTPKPPTSAILENLALEKNHVLSEGCSWNINKKVFSISVKSSALVENDVRATTNADTDHARLFSLLNKEIGKLVKVTLTVFGPPDLTSTHTSLPLVSPHPIPPSAQSTPRIIGSLASVARQLSVTPTPRVISASPSETFKQEKDHQVDHTLSIYDENPSSVLLTLDLPEGSFTNASFSGSVATSLFFTLSVQKVLSSQKTDSAANVMQEGSLEAGNIAHTFNVHLSVKKKMEEIEEKSSKQNAHRSLAKEEPCSCLSIYFDATQVCPTALRQSSPPESSNLRSGSASSLEATLRRTVVVAQCNSVIEKMYRVVLLVTAPVYVPQESEVYAEVKELISRNAVENPSTTPQPNDILGIDRCIQRIEAKYPSVFQLPEDEIEEFQLFVWSAVRQAIIDQARRVVNA